MKTDAIHLILVAPENVAGQKSSLAISKVPVVSRVMKILQ